MAAPWESDPIVNTNRAPTDLGTLEVPNDATPEQLAKLAAQPLAAAGGGGGSAPWENDAVSGTHGVDFSQPKETVRSQIATLPPEMRDDALNKWADYYVANNDNQAGNSVDDRLRAISRGSPIGSWLDEMNAASSHAVHTLTGGAAGAPYDEAVAYQRARDRAFDAAHPKESTALKIGGAIATIPLTPTVPVMAPASMLGRMANGMVNGAGYGALYGAGEGDTAGQRIANAGKGAGMGLGIGAAAPVVATGLATGAKYVADKLRPVGQALAPYARGAVDRISRAATLDELYPARGAPPVNPAAPSAYPNQAARLGNEGMLADMGTNLLAHTQGIVTQPGEGQTILNRALQGRKFGTPGTADRGARTRVDQDVTSVLGHAQNIVDLEKQVLANSRANAAPLYKQFEQTRIPVDEGLVRILQRVPNSAWESMKDLAQMSKVKIASPQDIDLIQRAFSGYGSAKDIPAITAALDRLTSPRGVDLIKRGLDRIAQKSKSTPMQTNDEALHRASSSLAKELTSHVDNLLSPGAPQQSIWAQARHVAGDGLQFREALRKGQDAFDKGTHPDQMRADLAKMNPVEQAAYGIGARAQVRDIMGQSGTMHGPNGDVGAMKALGNDQAREKLGLVVGNTRQPGQAPAAQLINRLEAEGQFERTRVDATRNSMTAARTAAQKLYPAPGATGDAAAHAGEGGITGLGIRLGMRGINALTGGAVDARNAAISRDAARMLSAQGPERDAIVRGLAAYANREGLSAQGRDGLDAMFNALMQSARPALIDARTGNDANQRQPVHAR